MTKTSQITSYVTPFKAILSIDFDGTICMSNYPDLGMQRKNARSMIKRLVQAGYGIIISTCREGIALSDAIKWLHKNDIPYHYVNSNFPHIIQYYGADCRKISADLYIDDKCLTGLPKWKEIYKITERKFR